VIDERRTDGKLASPVDEDPRIHESSGECLRGELPVTFTVCREFRQHEIVGLQAESDGADLTRDPWFNLDGYEAILPPHGSLSGFGTDGVRVVAEGLLEARSIAEGSFDRDRFVRSPTRVEVCFLRPEQRLGSVRIGSEDRLTADDDELGLAQDLRGRSYDVIEVGPPHR
jgi:hypothetical protein